MSPKRMTRFILLGGFFSMILLTIVLGLGAIRVSDNLIGLNASLFNHPFIVSNTLRDIKLDVLGIHRVMTAVLAERQSGDVDRAVDEIRRKEAHIDECFDRIGTRYLGDMVDVRQAQAAVSDWKVMRENVIALLRAGRYDEALAITKGEGPRQIDLIAVRIDGLIEFAHNKAAEFRAQSDVEHNQNMLILFGLIAVVVISGGVIAGFVYFSVARVERGLAEKEALFRQSQKMEAVGQLTGGLAHDLNNVLTIFSMNIGMLGKKVADIPDASKHVDALRQGFTRAADLTRKLLNFSRTRVHETRRVSVNEFVHGMEDLITKSLTPAIELQVELAENTWAVDIDPGDFETSLLNLALNARDAMPEGGALVIETANKVIDRHYVKRNPGSSAGDFVLISVSDTGVGMPPEAVSKAFEPFFTTKEVGQGTGLDLSMVYGFIQRSGGHVKIYSECGEGTTIHLYLPRAEGEIQQTDFRYSDREHLPSGGEKILVVDDETELVDAAVSFLESVGYRTIKAASGGEALEILRRDATIDLLFSDVVMPGGLGGYQLAFEALELKPDLRILLTSGFTRKREEFANGKGRIASALAKSLLHKPYNMAELAAAVHRTLRQPGE